ncbi:hypothetical protein PRIPAC_79046 [Pristionchus pacificus]|uniref:G protein-coupled receptor n=1 Tax=Pristionchus pacificus TaxID=54126 RepID=A0A2A6C2I0_PRIPA|nr:hypothetical protein PRIPAC_79046 [Pristionchus pacificus]|eukprot:PDM72233.1 G protein-coupled receptor [Pristionchus pacificus]
MTRIIVISTLENPKTLCQPLLDSIANGLIFNLWMVGYSLKDAKLSRDRSTIAPLIVESLCCAALAIVNILTIVSRALIVCTSLKTIVEFAFVLPYFVMQRSEYYNFSFFRTYGFFSQYYEQIIFSISVIADYGVLFFLLLIAINRYLSITRMSYNVDKSFSRLETLFLCCFVWLIISVITFLFQICDCKLVYSYMMYYNNCVDSFSSMQILVDCLIYLACLLDYDAIQTRLAVPPPRPTVPLSFNAIYRDPDYQFDNKRIGRLITESLAGSTSAVLNLILIIIMMVEGRKLFMSKWYVIVANLIVCTSLKSFVEVAFNIPYFIMQYDRIGIYKASCFLAYVYGYFSQQYELFIFNISVFADYGILFFSLLIALNRYVSITRISCHRYNVFSRWGTFFACCLVWLSISIITFLFNSCNCFLEYNHRQKMYYNNCLTGTHPKRMLLFGLIHIAFGIAIITLAVHARIFIVVRRISLQHRRGSLTNPPVRSRIKSQLLVQSSFIFGFFAVTIFCLFALSFIYLYEFGAILFAENMINLSIAIVYPIGLICLPGDMRSALITRFSKKSPSQNVSNLRVESANVSMANIPMHIMLFAQFHAKKLVNRYFQMVFVERTILATSLGTGMVSTRTTGSSASMLIIESLFGTVVALSNIIIIIVIISGWSKLMKYNFYVIVTNLTLFTSFKAVVEIGFILPYYVMQADGKKPTLGYFSSTYEYIIFNLSVFADYGVLFFSVLIAANRLYAVTRSSDISKDTKKITMSLCLICSVLSAVIPLLLYFCECQYSFDKELQLYHNECKVSPEWKFVLACLINLSYVCSIVVLLIYASILSVVLIPFLPKSTFSLGDIAYLENLLNLLIAAIYPICLLVMSGEMKTILASKFILSRSDRVTSIIYILMKGSNITAPQRSVAIGLVGMRHTADQIVPLVIESSFAMTVALSNLLIIALMIAGFKKLLKNNFYIILGNLIFFTSLKAVVECAFVVPYYVMQRDRGRKMGYFSSTYEWVFFNLSVFADYGVLFFSLLIAINRRFSITRRTSVTVKQRLETCASCFVVWISAAIIPVTFFFCECQFSYDLIVSTKMYYNDCANGTPIIRWILMCLVYLSYAVAFVVLCIYARTFMLYHREKHKTMNLSKSYFIEDTIQLNLLKQSAVIFAFYAASILCVFILSFVKITTDGFSEIAFVENLLNLSIAGIYPICFLCLSSELRRVLVAKIRPRAPARVASISLHTPNVPKANAEGCQPKSILDLSSLETLEVLANLIIFTSLKAIVELGFVLPYYIMQSNGQNQDFGYFSTSYELFIFNLSVLADYGVLFFSVYIATNRMLAVTRKSDFMNSSWKRFALSCAFVWICSLIIPLVFFFCNCQYVYSSHQKVYYNKCKGPPEMGVVVDCLVYLSYICCIVVLALYIFIYWFLRQRKQNSSSVVRNANQTNVEIRLLRQSVIVFLLYAASIASVFVLSFLELSDSTFFAIAYAENLLNLSIAAVYPICFLVMSGEMKSILISKIVPARSDRVASISLNNNINHNKNVNINENNHNINSNQVDGNGNHNAQL